MTKVPISENGKSAIDVARGAALLAGEIMQDRFEKAKEISYKGPGDIVTDVDREVEAEVFSFLASEYPCMNLVGEESSPDLRADKGYAWIVDPIDGTRNYAYGIPLYSTVVGLAYEGTVLGGVNYDPNRDELFGAERGKGAFLNGKRIQVSERASLDECIIGLDLSYGDARAKYALEMVANTVWPHMRTARMIGSSALGLSYVAAGRTDLYLMTGLKPWDQVAGLLLVEEAGGVTTDRMGRLATLYSDGIIASCRDIHEEFMQRTEGHPWREAAG